MNDSTMEREDISMELFISLKTFIDTHKSAHDMQS